MLQTVHVRVNDAATGKPTPVRIRFTDEAGTYYAPFGRLTDFCYECDRVDDIGGNVKLDRKEFAYIDGTCEIALPPGNIAVELSKGFEFLPVATDISIATGRLSLRLAIQRWIDMRKEHWFSGDLNCMLLSPHAALLEAQAEDVNVANLLALEWKTPERLKSVPNLLAFSGQETALARPEHIVVVNTQNFGGALGTLSLLNCHRIVFPLTISFKSINWTLGDWCDQCHRKGGLVACGLLNTWLDEYETVAQAIIGKIDAIGCSGFAFDLQENLWYHLLNAGLRIPIAGESRKASNAEALGNVRTYAHLLLDEPFTYKNWIEAVRRGATFATNGPLLTFTANGQEPSSILHVETDKIEVRARASSIIPFDRLEIVANGQIVASSIPSGFPYTATVEETLSATSGWWATRCVSEVNYQNPDATRFGAAHTSPVYVRRKDQPAFVDQGAVSYLMKRIDESIEWANQKAKFETPKVKDNLLATLNEARAILERRRS